MAISVTFSCFSQVRMRIRSFRNERYVFAAHFLRLCLPAGHTPQWCLCVCPCHSSAVSVPVSSLFIPFAASAKNAEIKRTFLSGFPRRPAESSIFCSQTCSGHLDKRAHAPHGSGLYRAATLIYCHEDKPETPSSFSSPSVANRRRKPTGRLDPSLVNLIR